MSTIYSADAEPELIAVENPAPILTRERIQLFKRIADLVLAPLALIGGLPLMLLVAAIVKLTSSGPVFYGHTRIGRHGCLFKAWKFRTMYQNGEAILAAHLACDRDAREEWARDHKLRGDPRITPMGRFLRRSSLDELPQIWNVLKGEMSMIGPRPIVTAEIPRYGTAFKLYTSIKPGITGLWQVSGRNDTSYKERVYFDEHYIRNWSLWLDLYIFVKTVFVLIRQTGAY